ncbi:MAG: VanW family protein [Patescibacteria group bacterium]|jgi:vancomycin resistance protein YoaR
MTRPKRNFLKKRDGSLNWIDLGFLVIIVAIILAAIFAVPQVYAKKILPGVWLGNVPVGGKTKEQAKELFNQKVDLMLEKGLSVTAEGKTKNLSIQQAVTSSDITPPLIDIDVDASLNGAEGYGHAFGFFRNTAQAWRAIIFRKHITPVYQTDELAVEEALRNYFGAKDVVPENSHLLYENGAFRASQEKAGKGYLYQSAIKVALTQWKNIEPAKIELTKGEEPARVTSNEVSKFIDQAQAVANRAPFSLDIADAKAETLDSKTIGQGLDVVFNKKHTLVLAFTESKLTNLIKKLQTQINVEAQDSRFRIENGKVAEFQQGKEGKKLDVASTLNNLNEQLISKKQKVAQVVIKIQKPVSASDSAQSLGITELVATGKTNFAGSPQNRRHNIANAVKLLNGLIIKPGEEFSLVSALAPIEKSNGYLSELVIKGNRTIPEVGGGLCQVGTTMFRLALNSGLPILERRNHSYRVSYYEPPVGMDATIYDPKPDFRVKNDYPTALLLQARVQGSNLIFDFYGTKDGREVNLTKPKLFNVTKPPATKYIKTTELKPGAKKRLERAHNGGSASFTYSVTKDGKTASQTFNSVYRAWQEVWLVGATAEEVAADQAA